MGQIRKMFTETVITEDNVTITSRYQNLEIVDTIARDGSEDTNCGTKYVAHKNACEGAAPVATSSPITISPGGNLIHSAIDSGSITVTGTASRINVPVGNTGSLKFNIFQNDGTAEYQKNGGSWTSFSDGDTLSIADGDILNVRATGLASGGSLTGNITDTFTSLTVDTFKMSNVSF